MTPNKVKILGKGGCVQHHGDLMFY